MSGVATALKAIADSDSIFEIRRKAYFELLRLARRDKTIWQEHLRCALVDENRFVEKRHGNINVIRDDLVPGGSKRRFLRPLIESEGDEWVYASPRNGYGQIALAYVCRDLGKQATIIVAKAKEIHPHTEEAQLVGAKIISVEMGFRVHCEKVAREYVEQDSRRRLAPFGFFCEPVISEIARLASKIKAPKEAWSIVSSGTLTNGLQRAWPLTNFFGVFIGHEPTDKERGRATIYKAPERFMQEAKILPPFRSCPTYDAKAWQFVAKHATPGALFWNVGA